jgi:hypothetical protein
MRSILVWLQRLEGKKFILAGEKDGAEALLQLKTISALAQCPREDITCKKPGEGNSIKKQKTFFPLFRYI